MLTLKEIKIQCRIDADYTVEDDFLELIGKAAIKRIETRTNRHLYKTEVPETDLDGLLFQEDIKLAALLLVGHWYENRTAVGDFDQTEVPMGFNFIIDPYRFIPL
ncbi:phage gp6-like head-tail connector protein [Limnobaculum zhutongyuii]|uniref:Phage gp6-like head-tail connector protein n=1 Tax=Limnobaculum zhutongyuii TaxID=2498113 RepID=A0A411WQE6_9GAMM|nr:head-tail connector protein [Limnobaculum zhutongyuii]QBH98417.1 phage gp6-like head-tail connector protein [Limnobaculum zhutongyuii]TQS89685.1 phage gp6-like head-tail connector protein [Limnobaculum zhutongyuii]